MENKMEDKMKLTKLSKKEMLVLKGGITIITTHICGCGCNGPSSSDDNEAANLKDDLHSPL